MGATPTINLNQVSPAGKESVTMKTMDLYALGVLQEGTALVMELLYYAQRGVIVLQVLSLVRRGFIFNLLNQKRSSDY